MESEGSGYCSFVITYRVVGSNCFTHNIGNLKKKIFSLLSIRSASARDIRAGR